MKLSQGQMAYKIQCSVATISKLERGLLKPSQKRLRQLLKAYRINDEEYLRVVTEDFIEKTKDDLKS